MAVSKPDENSRGTLTALSSTGDGTIVTLYANPSTHRLLVDSSASGGSSIGGGVTGGTQGSVLFINPSGILAQDNAQFYFQDNATTPSVLATNTNVALSINTSGDLTGTDTVNIYAQMDAFLPNSAITNSLAGLNTDGAFPGYTTSSTRGTGAVPVQLQANDMVGGYFGFGTQGASSPSYQNLGGIAIATTGASTNSLGGELRFYTKADGGSLAMPASLSSSAVWNNQTGTLQDFYNSGDQNAANYERARTGWGVSAANVYTIAAQSGGTGTLRDVRITAGSSILNVGTATTLTNSSVEIRRDGTSTINILGVASVSLTGSANMQSGVAILPTYNQTATAGMRALWISPQLTAVGSGGSLLIDAGTNSAANGTGTHTRVFSVTSTGIATMAAVGNAAGNAVSVDGTQTLTAKTLTTPTITKPVMSATNPTAQTYSPAGAGTATLDLSLSNQHDITMPAGNVTIALANDTSNQIFSVSITQDATGSRTVTWFGTIRWAGGSAPTLTTTASKRDRFVFIRTGSGTYDGMVMGMNI